MKWATGTTWLAAILGVLVVFLALLYANALQSPNFCRMTYMNPYYAEMDVDSPYSYKYNLLLYKEGANKMSAFLQNPRPRGIPVLFIPGNAGHYKQGRSLASASSLLCDEITTQLQLQHGPEFDFFTVDSREELSALNGEILMEQTQFVNDCIRAILSVYEASSPSLSTRPTNVLLVGHSMGGLIASAVFTQENYVADSVNTIITLNAPHNGHPFFYRKSISDFYHTVHQYWNDQIETTLKHVALISISGSFRDQLIDSSLTGVHGLIPTTNSFSVLTTGIPSVWVQTDHQCIVWCNQLIRKLSITLLDLVDPSTLQNTFSLPQRMRIFQKHLLSNIPSALGLSRPSDEDFLPLDYISDSMHSYHNPPSLASSHSIILLNETIFYEPEGQQRLPLVYTLPKGVVTRPLHFLIPPRVLEDAIHFVFITDLPNDLVDVYLCQEDVCTSSLSERAVGLPSHSSFQQYSGENRYFSANPSDNSPQTLFHIPPSQLHAFRYLSITIRDKSVQTASVAQFYTEKASNKVIKEKAFSYALRFGKQHSALLNITVPFNDRIGSYIAVLEPRCDAPLFPPVVIQYRPALHEQHIHTNASLVPLRFHISSDDNHRLILITDPQCEYEFEVTLNIPLTMAGLVYSNRTAFVAGIVAWWCFIFGIQQIRFYKWRRFPSFHASAQGAFFCCIFLLAISFAIPNNIYSTLFAALPEPLNAHSFFYFEKPSPISLRLILFCSFGSVLVLHGAYSLLLHLFTFGVHILHRITTSPVHSTNVVKGFILTVLSLLLGNRTHITISLIFAGLQLFISRYNVLHSPSQAGGIHESQKGVLFLLIMGIIETVPSVIQFIKAFLYEIRVDDGFLLGHYSLILLAFLATHFQPRPSLLNQTASFFAFFAILAYSLVPFYKVTWFITVLIFSCIISYFPLHKIPAVVNKQEINKQE